MPAKRAFSGKKLPHFPTRTALRAPTSAGEGSVQRHILRIVKNQRLTKAAHWTMFSLGLMSLGFSIAATAVKAFTP
jgi:hypothetical protein